jgi:site-specific DNA recombinase
LRLVIGQLQDFAQRVKEGMDTADWSTRRDIIRALVKRIEVGAEEVQVIYRVDLSPFADGPEGGRLPDCGRGARPHPC